MNKRTSYPSTPTMYISILYLVTAQKLLYNSTQTGVRFELWGLWRSSCVSSSAKCCSICRALRNGHIQNQQLINTTNSFHSSNTREGCSVSSRTNIHKKAPLLDIILIVAVHFNTTCSEWSTPFTAHNYSLTAWDTVHLSNILECDKTLFAARTWWWIFRP